jgi:putative intracellular protease/amidase/putative methionine-R-sulfoxide reductase with GAF domain
LASSAADRAARARSAAELIRAARGYHWVGLYDVTESQISGLAWSGPTAPSHPTFPVTRGLNGAAVAARAPVIVQDVRRDPRYLTTFGSTLAEAIFPVVSASGVVVGTIDVESDRLNAFTTEDEVFLRRCADLLAFIWELAPVPRHPVCTVGILAFDDVEVLDLCGPFEVFCAARPDQEHDDTARLFDVRVVGEELRTMRCRGGLLLTPNATIDTHQPLDILVLPGGPGARRERRNQRLLTWIREQDTTVAILASVCTGIAFLAEAGLLAQRRATTHWRWIEGTRAEYPEVELLSGNRYVDEGHIVTSAGVSAGIDMSLHLVERLHGHDVAAWTARRLEYPLA